MNRYRNEQANGGAGSCLQGGVPFLWLLDKPPAPGIKLPPRRILQPADTSYKKKTLAEKKKRAAGSTGISLSLFLSVTRRQQVH